MSFFGFDTTLDKKSLEDEDLAVYTWGEDSYDNLADALEEKGDDLNDETFGSSGPVGKDFDFASQTLPGPPPVSTPRLSHGAPQIRGQASTTSSRHSQPGLAGPSRPQPTPPVHSLEALWASSRQQAPPAISADQRHPQGAPWIGQGHSRQAPSAQFSPFDEVPSSRQAVSSQLQPQPRVRTLQDIEAELRATARNQQYHPAPTPDVNRAQQSPQFLNQSQVYNSQPLPLPGMPLSQPGIPTPHQYPTSDDMNLIQIERMLKEQQLSDPALMQNLTPDMMARMGRLPNPTMQMYPQHHVVNGGMEVLQNGHQHQPPQRSFTPNAYPMNGASFLQGIAANQFAERSPIQDPISRELMIEAERRHAIMEQAATKKIMEAEMMEGKRRRKAAKISKMSKYNDLMTQSDKDFITRIQVSQLVTQDPYSEDFYAQVYSSFVRSRMGPSGTAQKSMLKFANGAGVGVGVPGHRGAGRRENAMTRMQNQVERIIKNAQARQKDSNHAAVVNASLQGALGKTSGRINKAAPRQMLQVDGNSTVSSPSMASALPAKNHEELTRNAGRAGREAMNVRETDGAMRQEPLTHRQTQAAVERLYDSMLALEQSNREAPSQEDPESRSMWESKHVILLDELWTRSMIMIPVQTSDPHPFISILSLHKGKRAIPRLIRLLPEAKVTVLLVLLVACFHQLDVVRDAPILDELHTQGSDRWKDVSSQTDAFLMILPSVTSVLTTAALRLLTGLLNIMIGNGRPNVLQVVKSQAGIALLTAFFSRVDQLRHEENAAPQEDWEKWDLAFDVLLSFMYGSITTLFPSRRLQVALRAGYPIPNVDLADQVAWQFLAALAARGTQPQQMAIVAEVRDLILEIVQAVHNNWISDPEEATIKLANVNILLNAIGLDHTMLLAS